MKQAILDFLKVNGAATQFDVAKGAKVMTAGKVDVSKAYNTLCDLKHEGLVKVESKMVTAIDGKRTFKYSCAFYSFVDVPVAKTKRNYKKKADVIVVVETVTTEEVVGLA